MLFPMVWPEFLQFGTITKHTWEWEIDERNLKKTMNPTQAIGYALNKQEFTDAICMKYGWKVRHTHSLCLWRNKFCGSQSHMQTRWLHFNEAQLSERLWGTDNERFVGMFRPNPHFYQSMKMIIKEMSTLLTMQGWISLREDCGIAVRKLSLT